MNERPIHHVCYIVDDIPRRVDQLVETTGAGPFFHLGQHVEFGETLQEGEPCVFDHASAVTFADRVHHAADRHTHRTATPPSRACWPTVTT
jgi:hypothetical protein